METSPDASSRSNFDLGFAAGYRIGIEQEGEIAHGNLGYAESCAKTGFSPPVGSLYREGFGRAYQFGSADSRVIGFKAAKSIPPQ